MITTGSNSSTIQKIHDLGFSLNEKNELELNGSVWGVLSKTGGQITFYKPHSKNANIRLKANGIKSIKEQNGVLIVYRSYGDGKPYEYLPNNEPDTENFENGPNPETAHFEKIESKPIDDLDLLKTKLGDGLRLEKDGFIRNQYNLIDSDNLCYAHYLIEPKILSFEKWNGNHPIVKGRQHITTKEIEKIYLISSEKDTVKVAYIDGKMGYFLGSEIKDRNEILVDPVKVNFPVRRLDVDEILKRAYYGILATRDYIPSIRIGGEWVTYSESKHLRLLISEADEIVRKTYLQYLTGKEAVNFNYKIPKIEFKDILNMLFSLNTQDTFMEWVKSKPWDGIDRKSTLHKAIGLSVLPYNEQPIVSDEEDDFYCKAIVHMILVGAIQRHISPYVQDFVPVFIGLGGMGKSTTMKAFAGGFKDLKNGKDISPRWYFGFKGKINADNQGREFYRPQFGKAITELIEIDSILTSSNTGIIKSFFDADIPNFNEKFEKGMTEQPLTAFVVGTTNHERFLVDTTGNRRFLPVYMRQQIDTPNRESLKENDLYEYVNSPLYLYYHPEYMQQVYAQAYQEYLNNELYDFYVDREDSENVVLKVQKKLNLMALREPEYMDVFVGFMRKQCEKSYYKTCNWADCKTLFASENNHLMNKVQMTEIFEKFKENPNRFGFSNYGSVRISYSQNPTLDSQICKGFKLIDSEISLNFSENYTDLIE